MNQNYNILWRLFGLYIPGLKKMLACEYQLESSVADRLLRIENRPITFDELNHTLKACGQVSIGVGFWKYYFLKRSEHHPYPVQLVFQGIEFTPPNGTMCIVSLQHLEWGIRRFFYDTMLFWGDFTQAYHKLRDLNYDDICRLFAEKCVDTEAVLTRDSVKEVVSIGRDDRYLVSEMANDVFRSIRSVQDLEHVKLTLSAYRELATEGLAVTPAALREKTRSLVNSTRQIALLEFLYEDADDVLNSEQDIISLYVEQWKRFKKIRATAIANTKSYLSNSSELDVFVAASMGTRGDFRLVPDMCHQIFSAKRLTEYRLRYYDPTLSAADCPEDKGITACLMVRAAKAILYFTQNKESFGKAGECALGLIQGKPVIMLCPEGAGGREIYHRYRYNHPLVKQIQCSSNIVNGAIVTQHIEDVVDLLQRLITNRMEYDLKIKEGQDAYYLLKERITGSPVRVITDNELLIKSLRHT